jgi:hypothetical protein
MAESFAIPSFQTLVQISKRLQDISGQFILREIVVPLSELLSDLGLARAVVLYDNVVLGTFRGSVRRVIPSSLFVVIIIIVTTLVALTCVKAPQFSDEFAESHPNSPDPRHH